VDEVTSPLEIATWTGLVTSSTTLKLEFWQSTISGKLVSEGASP